MSTGGDERFIKLSNRIRDGEHVDDAEIRAAFDAVLEESDMSAARALQNLAEAEPERLTAYTADIEEAFKTCSDGTVRSNLFTILKEVTAERSTLPFEVTDELIATIRQGDPLLAAEGIAALTTAVKAGQTLPEEFVKEVFYRVARSPNDYVMSVGAEFLQTVVEAGGTNAAAAFESFGALLEEDQADMTIIVGQVLVDIVTEGTIPDGADVGIVHDALERRRDELGIPESDVSAALEALRE